MLARMVKQVWKDGGLPEGTINKQVTAAFAKKLWNGVVEGYGKDIVSIDYDSPDYKMLESLQKNVWSFAGAKNYHQLRELGNALIGADDKLVSFSKFKELALAINNKYTVSHLKTEYNLAVAGGQMAGKWEQIKEQQDIFPYLKFDAVLDKQTTDLCRDLDGTTLPIDHPFWKRYYPPNHFNCRSTVRQVTGGPVTPESRIPAVDIPTMFQTNLGEAGLIFPETHPYFTGLPKSVAKQAALLLPYENQFGTIEKYGKGYVRIHPLVNEKANDYNEVLQIAREKALQGNKADVLPTLNAKDPLREIIFPDAKPRKNPDLRINNLLWEIETATNAQNFNNIKHSISDGAKQANYVIINLNTNIQRQLLLRAAKGRFIDYPELMIIEFRYNGRYIAFNRHDLL